MNNKLDKDIEQLESKYLLLTKNQYKDAVVPLEALSIQNIESIIAEFISDKRENKFKLELMMMPKWAGNFKIFVICGEYYTHIKLKKPLRTI